MPTAVFQPPSKRTIECSPAPATPGPGHYKTAHGEDPRLRNIAIGSTFKQKTRHWKDVDVTPGPADYEDRRIELLKDTRPAYTMRLRPEKEVIPRGVPVSISPGPAAYSKLTDPVPDVQTAPWMKKVGRKTNHQDSVSPGPGDYLAERAKEKVMYKAATHKIGLKTKTGGPVDLGADSPGPQYTPMSYIGKGLAKSISAKDLAISDRNVAKESTTPGPGAYLKHSSSQPVLSRSPAYTWSAKTHANQTTAGRRSVSKMTGNPKVGPGAYEAYPGWNHKNSPAYSMPARAKVHAWSKVTNTPGPNYMPNPKPKKEYTMQGKNDYSDRTAEAYRNPGPGQYNDHKAWQTVNHDKGYDKTKGYTMGKKLEKKKRIDHRKHGLTHAEPKYVASKSTKPPSYSMVGRAKLRHEAAQPGPGHYNIKQTLFNSQPVKRLC